MKTVEILQICCCVQRRSSLLFVKGYQASSNWYIRDFIMSLNCRWEA